MTSDQEDDYNVIRVREVQRRTSLSRALIYREMQAGMFPRPYKLGPRAVGWRVSEINEWLRTRPLAPTM